jgi:hypothetical protein
MICMDADHRVRETPKTWNPRDLTKEHMPLRGAMARPHRHVRAGRHQVGAVAVTGPGR